MSGILSQFRVHTSQPQSLTPTSGRRVPSIPSNLSQTSSVAESSTSVSARSLSPPPSTQMNTTTGGRRAREDDNADFSGSLNMREHKRLKAYGVERSREIGAPDSSLDEFIEIYILSSDFNLDCK
ncbi:hypothetical protein AcW1_002447 [Taiwanofungus camphoratus]|nr:hypothetical protein AcV5_009896 [Antrodia cinnamomea]KAI0943232.1 hypothetical protein AcW1_002447 [Antrodia cinnamomea]